MINGPTANVAQQEKAFNPERNPVELAVVNDHSSEEYVGLTADVASAPNSVKILPEEQGLMLFEIQQRFFDYSFCYSGGRWGAYWWPRAGAFLARVPRTFIQ